MSWGALDRLRALEGKQPSETAELIRKRLEELGIGEPDPMDPGTALLIENILEAITK